MRKLGALAVVGGSVTALLVGGQLATGAAAPLEERGNRAPITARAPCDGDRRDTHIQLRLDDRERASSRDDRYQVSVTQAAPDRRWQLFVQVSQGDSTGVYQVRLRTDADGHWRFADGVSGGRHSISVLARIKSEARCEIELRARISPLS